MASVALLAYLIALSESLFSSIFAKRKIFSGRFIFYIVEIYAVEVPVFIGIFVSLFAWWMLDGSKTAIISMWVGDSLLARCWRPPQFTLR